jgi:serine/threonine-protein kinase HipA
MPPTQTLTVLMHGRRLGTLTSRGANHVELRYDDAAIEDPTSVALSLSLPLAGRRYRGAALNNWLRGLLPDRSEVLQRWRREFGIRRLDDFCLLWHLGEDVAGAALFVRPDRLEMFYQQDGAAGPATPAPSGSEGTVQPLTTGDVAERLRALGSDLTAWGPSPTTGQFSLAGAQAKFALQQTPGGWADPLGQEPTTHIFKPSIPTMLDQDLCEHLTMQTAGRVGLAVPGTSIETFGDQRVLVVQRFDRAKTPAGWLRVHQEDMCQAAGVAPANKYEEQGGPGIVKVTALIREAVDRSHAEADVREFLRSVGFNWLTVGTDAHAKNYALLYGPGQARLAPLYDLNSFLPYRRPGSPTRLSMKVGTWQTNADLIGAAEWLTVAEQLNVDPDQLLADLRDMAQRLPDAIRDVTATGNVTDLQSALPALMVQAITERARDCLQWLTPAPPTAPATPPARRSVCIHALRNRPAGWNALPLLTIRAVLSLGPVTIDDVGQIGPDVRDRLTASLTDSPLTRTVRHLGQTLPPVSAGPNDAGQPAGQPALFAGWTRTRPDEHTPEADQIMQNTRHGIYRLGTDGRSGVSALLTVRTPDMMSGNHVLALLDIGLSVQDGITLTTLGRLLRDALVTLTRDVTVALAPIVPEGAGPVAVELHWNLPGTVDNATRRVPEGHGVDFGPLGETTGGRHAYGSYGESIDAGFDQDAATALVGRAINTVALDADYIDPRNGIVDLLASLARTSQDTTDPAEPDR